MRSVSAPRRGRSPLRTFALVVGLCTLGGVATTGGLWATGQIDLPFLHKAPTLEEPGFTPPPGSVAVPLSAHAIPAYTKVTREHLFHAKKGRFNVAYLPAADVQAMGLFTDLKQILGRVLDHDKAAGYAFSEKDFLPEGTRAGVTAGVPPGKRSFVLETAKVRGLHLLKPGDRFSLVGTLPVDERRPANPSVRGASNPLLLSQTDEKKTKEAAVRVLVEDGVVVTAVAARPHAKDPAAPANARPEKTVEEMTIAVGPDEVMPLSEALALKAEITCVARSGRADDDEAKLPPPTTVEKKPFAVEYIRGKEREVVVFPRSGK